MNTIIELRKEEENQSRWLLNRADEILILSSAFGFIATLTVFVTTWF